ncbi:MAG: hypothetical protein IT292_11010 [Deltaproteobacteria bacterium]|nr:hypothetical protein [Deltaproteobacteria bacterium]
MQQARTKDEQECEKQIRLLVKTLKDLNHEVRREKLARGDSFRVKSGTCQFSGRRLLFIDSRLPLKQQITVMLDYIIDHEIALSADVLSLLPVNMRSLLTRTN